jgi:hypothetical protein
MKKQQKGRRDERTNFLKRIITGSLFLARLFLFFFFFQFVFAKVTLQTKWKQFTERSKICTEGLLEPDFRSYWTAKLNLKERGEQEKNGKSDERETVQATNKKDAYNSNEMASQNECWNLPIAQKGGICGEENRAKLSPFFQLNQLRSLSAEGESLLLFSHSIQ